MVFFFKSIYVNAHVVKSWPLQWVGSEFDVADYRNVCSNFEGDFGGEGYFSSRDNKWGLKTADVGAEVLEASLGWQKEGIPLVESIKLMVSAFQNTTCQWDYINF